MGEYFVELDKKFSNEFRGSAVDVDIFANNVKSDSQVSHDCHKTVDTEMRDYRNSLAL